MEADGRTEFGELAKHFNHMSVTLKKNYEKLAQEIQERRQAEAALRESEERYALARREREGHAVERLREEPRR